MKTRQTYYTLQRESDGAWLSVCYPHIKVTNEPALIKRLDTARRHRLRAIVLDGSHGKITISEINIEMEAGGALIEPKEIQVSLTGMVRVLSQTSPSLVPVYSLNTLVSLAERAEKLMLKAENAFRYLAVEFKNDDANNPTKMPVSDMRKVAKFLHDDKLFLIPDDANLVAMKLCQGFLPDFIYDFEQQRLRDAQAF